jgi:hypothetical protein
MKHTFDKEIRQLFENYAETPSPNCWDKVSSQLNVHVPDMSQSMTGSSANVSVFSQFAGSVAGKILIAVGSAAAIGGLAYLVATQDASDVSEKATDTVSHIEIPVNNDSLKEDIPVVVEPQPTSPETQETAKVQQEFVPQEEEPVHREENNPAINAPSVSNSPVALPTQSVAASPLETEQKKLSSEAETPQVVVEQEPLNTKQKTKETPQIAVEDQTDVYTEDPQAPPHRKPSIDVSKIAIANLLSSDNGTFVVGDIDKFPQNNLVVFQKDDGKIIYERANYRNEWKAENVPNGTYLYIFSFTCDGETYMRRGTITIAR